MKLLRQLTFIFVTGFGKTLHVHTKIEIHLIMIAALKQCDKIAIDEQV